MPLLNKNAFARKTGISRRDVGRLAEAKKIKENSEGFIDTDHSITKKYLASDEYRTRQEQKTQEATEKINTYASLEDQKLQADIQLKNEQALAVKTKRAQLLGLLIPKTMVDYKLSKLSEAISANLLTIPRRGTARSLAIIQSELEKQSINFDIREIKVHLELVWKELVSEALEKSKVFEND